MSTNFGSLVIQHVTTVQTPYNDAFNMNDFSSLKYSKLYLNGDIPGSWKLDMLQLNDSFMNIFESLDVCITLINNNGGFSIVGWYKRRINDKVLLIQ